MGIEFGDIISISFVERCDGEVLETNIEQAARDNGSYDEDDDYIPITISVGYDTFPDGLYDELIGKEIGAKGTVILPPERAYGEHRRENIHVVNKNVFEELPKIGTRIYNPEYGEGVIVNKTGSQFVVDFNNPLAGREIEYEYEIHEIITDPSEQFSRILDRLISGKYEASFENEKGTISLKMSPETIGEWNKAKCTIAEELFERHPSLEFLEFHEEYNNIFHPSLDEDNETDDTAESMRVKMGNIISISYIERCDGKVLRTNIEEIARNNGIYVENYNYTQDVFRVGFKYLAEGLHTELVGKEVGAKGAVILPPERAYGERIHGNIHSIEKRKLKADTTVGSSVSHQKYGKGVVINKIGKRFVVDFNNLLAGKDIEYEYEIHEIITDPSEQFFRMVKSLDLKEKSVSFENGKGIINMEIPLEGIEMWNVIKYIFVLDLLKTLPSLDTLEFRETYGDIFHEVLSNMFQDANIENDSTE